MSLAAASLGWIAWATLAPAPTWHPVTDDAALVRGTVTKEDSAPARVQTMDGRSLPLANLGAFAPVAPDRTPPPHFPFRLQWHVAESLLATPPMIGADGVEFSSSLGARRIPLGALERARAIGEGTVYFEEPWTTLDDAWQPRGGLALSRVRFLSPPSSLTLDRPGQSARRALAPPVAAGEVRLSFYDPGGVVPGTRWSVTFEFGATDPLEVTFEGGWERSSHRVLTPPSLPLSAVGTPRKTGWHRLRLAFGPKRLVVLLDDAALVSGYERGPEAFLAAIRLNVESTVTKSALAAATDPAPPPPAVAIDDIVVSNEPTPLPQRPRDPTRVTLIDARGDATLADQVTATAEQVELVDADGGTRFRLPWREARELTMPDPAVPEPDAEGLPRAMGVASTWFGEIGTVEFAGGTLVAELRRADAAKWTLGHPLLGECQAPADRIVTWRPRVFGRRTLVFPGSFHLGVKLVSTFPRPLPDGEALKLAFNHPQPLAEGVAAAATLWVMGMEGTGPLAPFASRIRAGELASELWLNDQRVDLLNRYLATSLDGWVELRVPLPAKVLRGGANLLEVRQTTDSRTSARDDAMLAGIAIEESEVPEPGKGTP